MTPSPSSSNDRDHNSSPTTSVRPSSDECELSDERIEEAFRGCLGMSEKEIELQGIELAQRYPPLWPE